MENDKQKTIFETKPLIGADETIKEAKWKDEEFRKIRLAFMNILEDTEAARQEAIREKAQTLAIINNIPNGIIVLDKDNKIELVNPLAESFLKSKKDELMGKNIFKISSPDLDLIPFYKVIKNGKKDKIKYGLRREIVMGGNKFLEVSAVPLEISEQDKKTLIIIYDVSRDKLIESMKTEFVSIAAHQLRTPLSAIKWTISMLLNGDVGKLTPEQQELLEKTYESNERMISLINDLLNVTRIEEGRFLYKPAPTHLELLTETAIQNAEDLLKIKKIKLDYKKPKRVLPQILADQEKVGLVIQNLLENAIKYTPEEGTIQISLGQEKNNILFKIKDSGVGIPQDQQNRIFTKFFRGSNVMRLETDGSGLGLYTAKNIIDAHKGKIWFESQEGQGTTFYFTLPIMPKDKNKTA
ncbi:MAG TPA: PAS domain-containing sensor histidine kinase [Candidatus Pacearchaeota archaeon]|jgi:PAS domain S-box-containing protein|nr:PAS domain-containing sensor histidine kinase [Candidatus Pacearchaeota archaeon]HPC30615.1 PAS domain-containing sensor histidine kinase [Candidatus Pacearchaeota archaeon]HQG09359.1 PAS domain-containing sensor histidine kinase [Candidatus Pacearchaeota archaeon]HQH20228.1 PAS domain-containing sensor histidine kinase [Candidatus Pacearchaeota archaeon]HRR94836.1 PAS domain-containing sensor histidine kinase [Candidatus Paceibacterota bacterium]